MKCQVPSLVLKRFEGWDIAISGDMATGGFFVFFVAVAMLATIMSAVQLVGWARAGEVRKRTLIAAFVLVFQLAFLIFVGIMFTTL